MMEMHRELAERWAGIPSGAYRIHALGRERDVRIDVGTGEIAMDMGDQSGLTPLPDHLIHDALDRIRAVALRRQRRADPEVIAQLRRDNAESNARGDWSCSFDSDDDPSGIPDGHDCGGCSCHLSAPCRHCMNHLPLDDEDVDYMLAMLNARGLS